MGSLNKHETSQLPICGFLCFHVLQHIYLEVGMIENMILNFCEDDHQNERHLQLIKDLVESQTLSEDYV